VFAPPLVAAALLYSLLAPWLAQRRVESAYRAVANGDAKAAIQAAESARELNPLSLDPLRVQVNARVLDGDIAGARQALVDAVELQPENPASWYELGVFEILARRPDAAVRPLERAAALDPHGDAPTLLADIRQP
jgi:Flp pilus assembly protein TadD